VDSRAGLDAVPKRKIPSPYREPNSSRPTRTLVVTFALAE